MNAADVVVLLAAILTLGICGRLLWLLEQEDEQEERGDRRR